MIIKNLDELKKIPPEELRARLIKIGQTNRQELEDIYHLVEELETQKSKNRACLYVPNGKCEDFIEIIGSNQTFISLFSAGNGVGKTALLCNLVVNICFGPQNKWFEYPLFKKFPYLRQGRIIADPTTISEKIVPELKKWMPKGKYETYKAGKSYDSHWETVTGFSFDLLTYDQEVTQFESVERGFIFFDEPPPRQIYRASVGRTRRGAVIGMFMTPLRHAAWVKNDIVDEADREETQNLEMRQKRYVTASIWDNCECCGLRGILKHEHIKRILAEYPEDEREARGDGKFGHLLGRVHKMFSREIHVIKPFALRPSDYAVYHFLDPHPRTPDAAIWVAVDRNEQMFVISDLWMQGPTSDLAYQIKKKEQEMNMRIEGRWIDPTAYTEDKHIQKSLADELGKFGLYYQPGSKDLEEGIRMTNEALTYVFQKGNVIIKPRLFVFNTCERTIWEFENYIWDEWKGRQTLEKNPKQKPKDVNDHMMENIHRALLAQISWQPMVKTTDHIGVMKSEDFEVYA